jgi:hypothetical protein
MDPLDEALAAAGAAPKAARKAAPAPEVDPLDEALAAAGPPPPSPVSAPQKAQQPSAAPAGPEPPLWDRVKASADNALSTVGALGTRYADAASLGMYSKARNAIASRIAPDATAAQVNFERKFGEEHPFIANSATAAGYLTPGGAPEMLARGADALLARGASAVPGLAGRVLASAPVRGAAVGAATNAGTTAGEDLTGGASISEAAHDAGRSALLGGALGAGAAMAPGALQRIGEGAQNRQVDRTLESLELNANKRTRAGIRQGPVEDAVRELPELRKAAGNDNKVAQVAESMKARAGGELKRIYAGRPEVGDVGPAISRMDERIAKLRGGTSTEAAVADQLQGIRDELNDRLGTRDTIKATDLRAEQSAYQKKGYGKSMPGDDAASARIAANREASKAVGDAVLEHVTGMDYETAKAAAKKDPSGLAARLLKANETITAANRIEASIADRAQRVQPREGLAGKLMDAAKEIKHSPAGYVLSKAPSAAARVLNAGDDILARGAASGTVPRPTVGPSSVARLVQLARSGATREQLTAQAQTDGMPPEVVQRIATEGLGAVASQKTGPLEPGNIDLAHRPVHHNPDGSISTVRSMSFQDEKGGPEILVPTIADDGTPLSDDQAIALYHRTGKHLGKFANPDAADAYAQKLHEDQARMYAGR